MSICSVTRGLSAMNLGVSRRYRLSCRDLGVDDDFVSSGKSRADVMVRMIKYLMRVHGVSCEDLHGYRMRQVMRY